MTSKEWKLTATQCQKKDAATRSVCVGDISHGNTCVARTRNNDIRFEEYIVVIIVNW